MRKGLKALMWVAGFMIFSLLALLLWYRQASLPQTEGELQVSGLKAAVDVVRDSNGIPHIYAESKEDAYFALGFVHAQDRLWQLELNRRIVSGRMAEVLGGKAVDTDRFLRTLGVRRNAEAIFRQLDGDTQAILEAYAKGINSYLSSRTGPLPPEFLITGAPEPEPWQPADSIGWQTMLAWDLGANWTQELLRMRLAQKLSLQQINEFLAPYPGDVPVETGDYTQFYRNLAGLTEQLAKVQEKAPPSLVEGMGSNNWVLSGKSTASGKPLLANDPHLALSAPSLWYFAHLDAPDLHVTGASFPGIPAIVLGHNRRIAWGFTNTAPDTQDLYVERINPANPTQYQTPKGWAGFKRREELIKVKGGDDVKILVQETRHGPVISRALPILDKAPVDASQYVISFAWAALRPDDKTIQAGIRFNQAGNWNEFTQAASDFHSPQQSIVYADIDGNIGFVAPGRVPVRKKENDMKGLAPAPGWDKRYDWEGFIPFKDIPMQYNPASGRVVTANHKIVDKKYPYFITSEWALPYRADRINALLDTQNRHESGSFMRIQQDHLSLAAQQMLPLLLSIKPLTERSRQALGHLAKWDGLMEKSSPDPLIFNAWIRRASYMIFSDELGSELMNDYWDQRNVHLSMVNVLKNRGGQGRWCKSAADQHVKDCGHLLSIALEDALGELERHYGNKMTEWKWGEAHMAHSEHRPFGKVPLIAPFFDIRVPTPGDTFTINVGRYNMRDELEPFASRHAAGMRAVYDLANLEQSRFIHSTGQSGNPFSRFYRNFVNPWAEGDYLVIKSQRQKIDNAAVLKLTVKAGQ
jgi:penicillin amidase